MSLERKDEEEDGGVGVYENEGMEKRGNVHDWPLRASSSTAILESDDMVLPSTDDMYLSHEL